MISVVNAVYAYPNGVQAVSGVSLEINPGERIALVGQNGAGKSTLSRLLNGLVRPVSGNVYVDEMDTGLSRADEVAALVGYVFQNPDDQIFSKSIWDECAYALQKRGVPEDELEDRVSNAIKLCGLGSREDLNPLDLPLAERKFVTTAAAIALRPKYLILDEPTAGLDEIGRDILTGILDWAEQEGIAVVAVSHDMRFVIERFRRVVVMAGGKIVADGSVGTVFANASVLATADLNVPPAVEVARSAGAPPSSVLMADIVEYLSLRL